MVKYNTIIKIIEKELNKTHDGTNLKPIKSSLDKIAKKIRNKKKEQAYLLDENGNIVLHKKGTKHGVEWDEETELKGHTNLHITHNHPEGITIDDIPTTFSKADMLILRKKNNEGEYYYKSISAESPNGTRITLIKNNKFSTLDEDKYFQATENYSYACTDYNRMHREKVEEIMKEKIKEIKSKDKYAPINHLQLHAKTQEEVTKEIGTLNDYLKEKGIYKQFEKCNCKFRITKNPVDWKSKL